MLTTPSASPQIGAAKTAASHNPLIRFQVTYKEKDLGEFTLHIPGAHNVLNATAPLRSAPRSTFLPTRFVPPRRFSRCGSPLPI